MAGIAVPDLEAGIGQIDGAGAIVEGIQEFFRGLEVVGIALRVIDGLGGAHLAYWPYVLRHGHRHEFVVSMIEWGACGEAGACPPEGSATAPAPHACPLSLEAPAPHR